MPLANTTFRSLTSEDASAHVGVGAVYIDIRTVPEYLDVHVPGSICLQYEFGPGFPVRARDCIPLEVPLILLDRPDVDMSFATASLRGKGFAVLGVVEDGLNAWARSHGTPASTEVYEGGSPPSGTLLDVGDPQAPAVEGATRLSIERLWNRAPEIAQPVVIVAGRGVRAAMAVGMLERAGKSPLFFWRAGRRKRA
ncbi:MAG: hypothetical protein QOH90_710 [Actinomycetota bacterium]|jgi:rhodanese-related sulfurtransferase|nr:hypothetical protein [Actinomycetota bacterium]